MIEPEKIVEKIQGALADAEVEVTDLTGTRDHYEVEVVSTAFEGKTLIQQHRLIYDALDEELDGPIHALTLETKTPDATGDSDE
jgi:stress-induced morphogen